VVTRDYIGFVKDKKESGIRYPESKSEGLSMRETAGSFAIDTFVNVRQAKSQLSALLEWVAGGREVTITSDGKPKARLVPAAAKPRKLFTGMGEFLLSQPVHGGPTADELIREDRDGRGW
jgi:prevent-host-death family protein